ncbi:MAG TPA: exopolysaccharide biosynthesis polyprenyl glycosylphosphotransferase [Bryobacteraceae bacterium]|nr:exopolysaccharide biosynthesis polyprenyl glycosylphosphotransferase [Bryobacteraceae bacterium]
MSTAARPRLAALSFQTTAWASWAILGSDIVALEIAFSLGLLLHHLLSPWFRSEIGPDQYLGVAAGILLLPVIHCYLGLYPGYLLGPVERLRRRTLATIGVFGGLVAWDNLVARGVLSRGILLATFVFAVMLPPIAEAAVRKILARNGRWGAPVIMLGCGGAGRAMARTLQRDPDLGLQPVAFLDDRPETWNTVAEGVPVLGPLGLAQDFERRAHAAIVLLTDLGAAGTAALLHDLNFPRVIVVPDLGGMASLWVSARNLGGSLGLEIKKNLLLRRNHALKSLMDRAIALPLFVLSLPLLAAAAVWIKLCSRGPALYRQMREGLDGQRIRVWKLRTMYVDGDRLLEQWLAGHPEDELHWKRYFKLKRDPRVLPVIGRFLRRTSLDELPQLWSVLTKEMSLVGPRPLPDYHIEQFPPEFRGLRTRVLPGLTGLWQISARGDGDLEVQEALDTFYIRNWSPWLDLYILARTVTAVLLARGAY